MAVINLSVTVPNAQVPRLEAAAKAAFGQVPDGAGGMRDLTSQEIVDRLKLEVISILKGMVIRYERSQAIKAAESLEPVLDAT